MSRRQLYVYYDAPIEPELDKAVREVIESFGWRWLGQGMNLLGGERDICFDKNGEGNEEE